FKCWAAALESWCRVTPGRTNWTQAELVKRRDQIVMSNYGREIVPAGQEGYIDAVIYKKMVQDPYLSLRMEFDEVAEGKDKGLESSYFFTRLFDRGYLFIVYTTVGGVRHANVIFAASEDGYVSAMDPMRSRYADKAMEEFKSPFLLAWADYQTYGR